MKIRASEKTLGAYVEEADLTDLSDAEWKELKKAFLEYAVLVLPEVFLTTSQQERFSERFGKLDILTGNPLIKSLYVCNVNESGEVLPMDDENFRIVRGNEYWHTDSSYMRISAKVSCLSALTLPDSGGETQWADMRAAYDELDQETRNRIEHLSAYHSFYFSQETLGQRVEVGSKYGFHRDGAPLRTLVKVHSETGRPALYIGRHAYRIPGLLDQDARELLSYLMDFACKPPRVFEHKWNLGDFVMWDNRCVLHRVRPYDYSQPRIMRHTRVKGDEQTEGAPMTKSEQPPYGLSAPE
ncbi:MAG: TauD/TfdA family dioxygenase [Gammaproteobacteria bacterium]|nr:TauD/TfdA family dioxygenase [Gammaproteobacteria bacterium]